MTTTEGGGYTYPTFTGLGPKDGTGEDRDYIISPQDAKIVDFAIKLGRPLLVEGEAGCGKTRLAYAISAELGLGEPIVASVRSTSRANDLLYRFDALRRLQDSQLQQPEIIEQSRFAHNYVRLQPLGEAIFKGRPKVVLIDEVDKGDKDFPNDLLQVLDTFEFQIDEIPHAETDQATQELGHGSIVKGAAVRPIVLFTSNREQQLPKPFLRRCLYLELKFPDDPVLLEEIVRTNLYKRHDMSPETSVLGSLSNELVSKAVRSFLTIRDLAKKNRAVKVPATAELIDWVHILHWEGTPVAGLDETVPPYWRVLFATANDINQQARAMESEQQASDKG